MAADATAGHRVHRGQLLLARLGAVSADALLPFGSLLQLGQANHCAIAATGKWTIIAHGATRQWTQLRPAPPRDSTGVFDMPALEGLASEPGSGQPELGLERPVALFDVVVWFEPS
jgi:hypothetical protein